MEVECSNNGRYYLKNDEDEEIEKHVLAPKGIIDNESRYCIDDEDDDDEEAY
jgi:hypothetical protein